MGGWLGWIEENEADRMNCWSLRLDGWVGGWVGEGRLTLAVSVPNVSLTRCWTEGYKSTSHRKSLGMPITTTPSRR